MIFNKSNIKVRKTPNAWILISLLVIFSLLILTVGNYYFSSQNPGGNDFLVHWTGLRLFFQKGISPYSDEAATQIQILAYGHPANPGQHELRVAYPIYSVLIFGPFLLLDNFNLARAFWMTLLELTLLGLSFVSIKLTGWKPRLGILVAFLLFSIFWYHGLRTVINGNAVLLVGLALTGSIALIKNGLDEAAGFVLALSTIKPQVVLVFIVYIFFWAIVKRRFKIILWFAITLGILIAFGALLIPDWITQNLREVLRYASYNPPGTLTAVFGSLWPSFGARFGTTISILIIALLLVEWWLSRKGEINHFLWVACLTLVCSQWVGIQSDPGNFIIMVPALVLVFSVLQERWKKANESIALTIMFLLLVVLWAIFAFTLQIADQPVQSPVMFLILPAILLILLYWVRWWIVRPHNVWYDEIKNPLQKDKLNE
jgi:hypothetical protein